MAAGMGLHTEVEGNQELHMRVLHSLVVVRSLVVVFFFKYINFKRKRGRIEKESDF